jgi:hypothetical protein
VIGEDIRNRFVGNKFSLGTIYFHGMSIIRNIQLHSDTGFRSDDVVIMYDMNPPYEDHRDTFRGAAANAWKVKTKIWYKTTYLEKSTLTGGYIFQTPYYFRKVNKNGDYLGGYILTASDCQSADKDTIDILLP